MRRPKADELHRSRASSAVKLSDRLKRKTCSCEMARSLKRYNRCRMALAASEVEAFEICSRVGAGCRGTPEGVLKHPKQNPFSENRIVVGFTWQETIAVERALNIAEQEATARSATTKSGRALSRAAARALRKISAARAVYERGLSRNFG